MSQASTPQERMGAFLTAVDEELLRPVRRYLRGFRRGLVVGIGLGLLLTPIAGRDARGRIRLLAQSLRRLRSRDRA
ncbi:MAG: hypothetical protein ACYCUD_03795 [Candidatus Dormibacteria bacterium]